MYFPPMATLKLLMKPAFFVVALHVIVSLDRNSFSLVLPKLDEVFIKI